MSRAHAQLLTSIWTDEDFLALTPGAQRMYMLLVSQPDLNYAGVLVHRPRRWARLSKGTTVEQVERWLAELSDAWFIAIDADAEELLIRSLIRNDGIWRQPNVFRAACRSVAGTLSRTLRGILRGELERLPLGELADKTRERIESDLFPLVRTLPEPIGKPFQEPFREGFAEPLPEPLGKPPGEGGRGSSRGSPSTEPSLRSGSARPNSAPATSGALALAAPHEVPTAQTLLAEYIDACKKRPPDRVIGQVAKQIRELLTEGIEPEDVRAGVELWRTKALSPSLLPSVVNEVMNGVARLPQATNGHRPSTTDQRVAAGLALAEKYRALEENP